MKVLVTGASSGFGAAIARRFHAAGDEVIIAGRRLERLNALKSELGGRQVHALKLDVRDKAAVEQALAGLPAKLGEIDVLVNNAGLAAGIEPAPKTDFNDWKTMVDTNIMGLLHLTHAVLPGMVARGRGHVINLGSIAGEFPYPGGNVYGATKAFVHQLSLNLRADLLGTPVRVTCVEPGLCSGTEFSSVRFKGDRKRVDALYAGVDALTADDVAETVHWVASRPAHVNINVVSMMPVQQAFSPLAVSRRT